MECWLAEDPEALIRGRARVGAAEITVCTDGTCRFDGGAMFGVVPKVLWGRTVTADEQNRVELGLNCVVVRAGGRTVLIETGFGNKLKPKLKAIMATQELLPASLDAAGVAPESVDFVINTHLHWDHCGWNATLDEHGGARTFFPHATYVFHAGEVEHGRMQTERDAVSYVPVNYEPMIAAGQARLIRATEPGVREEICPGVSVECFPGHTAQMMVVHVESEGERACFVSDLMPTAAHLPVTWVMAFDLDPMRTIAEKKRWLASVVNTGTLVLFPHDHRRPMALLVSGEDGKIALSPIQ